MDFFDIFIFNNVKSCHKIKFCQQNKTDSDIKLLPLCRLYPYRKPRWAEVGQTYIWYKAFLYALVLTIDELRKFNCKSKTKQCRTPHEVYYIQLSLASNDFAVRCHECILYSYTRVGLSALLVSTTWAMPEPLHCGTSDRTGSTFSCIYTNHLLIMPIW